MTVDPHKVRQKLQYIRSGLRELEAFKNMDEEAFKAERYRPVVATRTLEVAIEAMLDLCAHIIAREGWGLPKSYREVVLLAGRHDLVPKDLVERFLLMVGFRNRVVHLYDEPEEHEILQFIRDHAGDLRPFIARVIERYLDQQVVADEL